MKKSVYLFLIVLITFSVFFGAAGTAFAQNDCSLSVTQKGGSGSGITAAAGDTVHLAAAIQNGGSELVGYSVVCDGNPYYSTDGTLAAGEGKNVNLDPFTVTQDMINNGSVTFQLYSGGSPVASNTVPVRQAELAGIMNVTVTPDSSATTYWNPGDAVKFTFNIQNQGETELENITVKAKELGNKTLFTPFILAPGSAPKTLTYNDFAFKNPVTIHFVITYTINNGSTQSKQLDPIKLDLYNGKVTATLTADNTKPDPGEEVHFTLEVIDSGNITYTNVAVTWNGQSMAFPTKTLVHGDDKVAHYTLKFDTSQDVSFNISMKNSKNEIVSVSTKPVSIMLPIDQNALKQNIKLVVKTDRSQMTSGGTITFSGYVSNDSIYALKNVSVSDPSAGEILNVSEIDPGTRTNISQTVNIDNTTTYNFVMTATDRDGTQYTFSADPITVTVVSAQASPSNIASGADNVTEAPVDNPGTSDPLMIWIIAAVIIAVLIVAVGAALVVLWRRGMTPSRATAPKAPMPRSPVPRRKPPLKSGPGKPRPRDRNYF